MANRRLNYFFSSSPCWSTRARRFLYLCLLCALIAGCSSKPNTDEPATKSAESANENSIDIEKPATTGVFVRDKGTEIKSGELALLMPTNAKRGFGFGQPTGNLLAQDVQQLTILDKSLSASQLQITMFKGVAVNSDSWFTDVDDSNTAWLPAESIPSKVRVINDKDGFAVIDIPNALPPGFYVLHDNSLMKASDAKDVSAYYPFIVTKSKKADPWTDEANACFKDILEKYQDHLSLRETDQHGLGDVKKCATKQRIAWKLQSNHDADYKLRLIYLSRIIDAFSDEIHSAVLANMNENGSETAQLLWKIEQYDQLQRLNLLVQNKGNPDIVHAVLRYYHNDTRETSVKTLHWIPFLWLENDDPELEAYFNDIRLERDWEQSLVKLLGAIQYKQLFTEAGRHKALAPWFKQIDGDIGKVFKDKSVSLSFRREKARIAIGPVALTGVPSADVSTWRATLKTFEKDVRACVATKFNGSYTLILEQPLTGDIYGHASRGVMHDPVASIRNGIVPPPKILDCILDVYTKLPASSAIDVNQKASIAISISQ